MRVIHWVSVNVSHTGESSYRGLVMFARLIPGIGRRHLQKTLTLISDTQIYYDVWLWILHEKYETISKMWKQLKSLLHLVNIVQKQWKHNLYFVGHSCSVPSSQMKFNAAQKITKNWPRSIQPVLTTTDTVLYGPWKDSALPIPSTWGQLVKSHATSVWHQMPYLLWPER